MTFKEKLNQKEFWVNAFKVAIPFFIFVTIISLLINNWSDVFTGNFNKVAVENFNDGKWMRFWSYKIIFSVGYGIYMANKNMK
jgi:hypothetical protein